MERLLDVGVTPASRPRGVSSSRPSVLMMITARSGRAPSERSWARNSSPFMSGMLMSSRTRSMSGMLLQAVERLPAVERVDQRVLAQHHLVHLVHQLRVVDDEHFSWLHGALPERESPNLAQPGTRPRPHRRVHPRSAQPGSLDPAGSVAEGAGVSRKRPARVGRSLAAMATRFSIRAGRLRGDAPPRRGAALLLYAPLAWLPGRGRRDRARSSSTASASSARR